MSLVPSHHQPTCVRFRPRSRRLFLRHGRTGRALGSLVHGGFIALSNSAYHLVARRLTSWENHRTAQSFEGSLIIKSCVFVFCNSYSSEPPPTPGPPERAPLRCPTRSRIAWGAPGAVPPRNLNQ